MSSPVPPRRVPTLTEVVAWPPSAPPTLAAPTDVDADPAAAVAPAPAGLQVADELLVQRVLAGVQRQVDLMLEYRLREILTPLLTRAADGIVREARTELSTSLRDLVARAVAQELARQRGR